MSRTWAAPTGALRVALVDDDEVALATLAAGFASAGVAVETFTDVSSLLSCAEPWEFDAYVVDWNLAPDQTSEDLLRTLSAVRNSREACSDVGAVVVLRSTEVHLDPSRMNPAIAAVVAECRLEARDKAYPAQQLAQEISVLVEQRQLLM
jgi:CheY-like chemotaxis protein